MTVGGGIVSEPETYHALLLSCFTVWIRATPDEHMAPSSSKGEPAADAGHAEAMRTEAHPCRRESALQQGDATLDTSGETPQSSLARLRQLVPP